MRLIAVWGPARAGSYAYVSPIIAVLLGVLVLGEHVALRDAVGMARCCLPPSARCERLAQRRAQGR
jgi:drug/metabolite transporter (DMT)-like permease